VTNLRLDRLTNHLLKFLQDNVGRPVGDHDIPGSVSQPPGPDDFPYCILYSIDGGGFDGPMLTSGDEFADREFQVTSVGLTREQCQFMAARVHHVMTSRNDDNTGYEYPLSGVALRQVNDPPGGVSREGETPVYIWQHAQRYTVRLLS
jgi:hypothetical protein